MALKCTNHPVAPSIDNCCKCQAALCGICANFTDDGVLCEKCVKVVEINKKVASRRAVLQRPRQSAPQPDPQPQFIPRKHSRMVPQTVQILIILACGLTIAVRMLFFATPGFVPLDEETRARELAIVPLDECLRRFREIGRILAAGRMPAASLRCDDSGASNIVTGSGASVRIEHPQPDFYGYSQIYVTRSDPEPVLVD